MKTSVVTVNNSGWTSITPQTQCREIIVCETNQAGTTDYLVAAPTSADGPKTIPAGKEFHFTAPSWTIFRPDEGPRFYLKTATGSVTFDILEL